MVASASPRNLSAAAAKNLPVYIISGEQDPIVGPGQGLSRALAESYIEAGIRDVAHRIYPGGRHEMFNETNRAEVMNDLAGWLTRASSYGRRPKGLISYHAAGADQSHIPLDFAAMSSIAVHVNRGRVDRPHASAGAIGGALGGGSSNRAVPKPENRP